MLAEGPGELPPPRNLEETEKVDTLRLARLLLKLS